MQVWLKPNVSVLRYLVAVVPVQDSGPQVRTAVMMDSWLSMQEAMSVNCAQVRFIRFIHGHSSILIQHSNFAQLAMW